MGFCLHFIDEEDNVPCSCTWLTSTRAMTWTLILLLPKPTLPISKAFIPANNIILNFLSIYFLVCRIWFLWLISLKNDCITFFMREVLSITYLLAYHVIYRKLSLSFLLLLWWLFLLFLEFGCMGSYQQKFKFSLLSNKSFEEADWKK